ncbi:phage tail protein I [Sphingobium yanoikuyae]|uniref:phage tail protein I n=1 Tax=Sphingobium yanoikuyae TaxID=13690 RepID=UPI002FDB73EE
MTYLSLLPPGSTPLERALEQVAAWLTDLPAPLRDLWSPQSCPYALLPWLAWGLSVDIWEADWPEDQKRQVITDAIAFQRQKGTLASLRTVLDRFDPLIRIVEWFEQRDLMAPHTVWAELPFRAHSDTDFDDATLARILRDIAQVKPVRAQLTMVYHLRAEARAYLIAAAGVAGLTRLDQEGDLLSATQPIWDSYLQTEDGEPIVTELGAFMECP